MNRAWRRLTTVFALAMMAGCAARTASLPPVVAPVPVQAPAPRPSAALPDSSPSPAALAVLATIPEPLSASERATPAPPRAADAPVAAPAAGAGRAQASDTLTEAGADTSEHASVSDTVGIPVPAPVVPLGRNVAPSLPPPAAPAAPPIATPVAAPVATADADSCWRVQVGAPIDRVKGKQLRDASESLLLAPMVVDREGGRFKVRSRDCLSRVAAEALRDRAIASGFKGVFLVRLQGPPR